MNAEKLRGFYLGIYCKVFIEIASARVDRVPHSIVYFDSQTTSIFKINAIINTKSSCNIEPIITFSKYSN